MKTLDSAGGASRGYERLTRIPQHHQPRGSRLLDGGQGTYAVARAAVFRNKWVRVLMMCLDILGLVVAVGGVAGLIYVFREFTRTFDHATSGAEGEMGSVRVDRQWCDIMIYSSHLPATRTRKPALARSSAVGGAHLQSAGRGPTNFEISKIAPRILTAFAGASLSHFSF